MKIASLVGTAMVFFSVACSDSSSSSSSQSFKCCLNGAYYDCATQDAFSHCGKSDVEQFCPRKSTSDDQCK